jgi:hypothetical protein
MKSENAKIDALIRKLHSKNPKTSQLAGKKLYKILSAKLLVSASSKKRGK